MEAPAPDLVVRQHERRACRLVARVRIGPADAARVVLSRTVGDGAGVLDATVVDVSRGGVGLESTVFLPCGAHVVVSLPAGPGGHPIEFVSRVQRVSMISRGPTYYIGLAFACEGTDQSEVVGALVALAEAAAPPEGGRC